jgi:hypothetical protein
MERFLPCGCLPIRGDRWSREFQISRADKTDEHRPTLSRASGTATSQDGSFEKTKGAAGDIATYAANAAAEVVEHAKTAAEGVIDHAKTRPVMRWRAGDIARQAPEIARRVRDHAGTLADDLYRSGSEYVSRRVATYPLASVVMAAVVGYGLGYLFSRRQ